MRSCPRISSRSPADAPPPNSRPKQQILSLVEDALAVGLEGEGRFRLNAVPVDIRRDVVEQNWANIQLQRRFADKLRKIRMELEVAPDVPDKGVMDPHRVAQVICNLVRRPAAAPWHSVGSSFLLCLCGALSRGAPRGCPRPLSQVGNAIRFVPEGTGFVKMTVSFSHDDDLLVISVADNGVGLTREHMNRLFLPFRRGRLDPSPLEQHTRPRQAEAAGLRRGPVSFSPAAPPPAAKRRGRSPSRNSAGPVRSAACAPSCV